MIDTTTHTVSKDKLKIDGKSTSVSDGSPHSMSSVHSDGWQYTRHLRALGMTTNAATHSHVIWTTTGNTSSVIQETFSKDVKGSSAVARGDSIQAITTSWSLEIESNGSV